MRRGLRPQALEEFLFSSSRLVLNGRAGRDKSFLLLQVAEYAAAIPVPPPHRRQHPVHVLPRHPHLSPCAATIVSIHTLAMNPTHFGGYVELDTHNLWGLMEAMTTHKALKTFLSGKRPFINSRSAFASAGKWAGHRYMYLIQGILPHQIPFVGADTYGFNDNSDEELCNRMQLAAFTPFHRNHNVKGAIS
ncbi:glycosyl hydrolases family 31-domain-containing protein [Mycena galericulata]|nr:glycosyl hydrolases family 31-domain-containing protein [Mycena galericulata]